VARAKAKAAVERPITHMFAHVWLARRQWNTLVWITTTAIRSNECLVIVNNVLAWMLTQEAHLIVNRCELPFGMSVLVVAQKQ
jgi:hypothetical protein